MKINDDVISSKIKKIIMKRYMHINDSNIKKYKHLIVMMIASASGMN